MEMSQEYRLEKVIRRHDSSNRPLTQFTPLLLSPFNGTFFVLGFVVSIALMNEITIPVNL